jgi:photosystem II stability/assembly factor-like uncharacterized protein
MFTSFLCSQWYQVYQSSSSYPGFYSNLYFIDQNTGFVVCRDSAVIKTTNSGLNWSPITGTSNYGLSLIQFTSPNVGYALGNVGFNNAYLLKTINGGSNWVPQNFSYYAFAMKFVDDNTGYITDDNGTVHKTINGGASWSAIILNALLLTAIDFINSNTGYVGTASNEDLFKTTNGGINWQVSYSPNFDFLKFLNSSTGYGVLNSYTYFLYKTTNSGAIWQDIFQSDSGFIGGLFFIDVNTGWLSESRVFNNVVIYRKLFKTTNAGSNWFEQSTGYVSPDSSACLGQIQMINENTGFVTSAYCEVVGGYPTIKGRIYKTTNGGGDPIGIINNNELIHSFRLDQNYPNPFNPGTIIRFNIKDLTFTTLKVFDVLGREIATLVDEQLKPGTYEVEWNASNYPGGIYFYCLTAGDYKDTKKMILIK